MESWPKGIFLTENLCFVHFFKLQIIISMSQKLTLNRLVLLITLEELSMFQWQIISLQKTIYKI